MTLYLHEIKSSRRSLAIWTIAISFMLCVAIFIYPEMSGQMEELNQMMSDMGAFSSAFGMDQLNFGEFSGYYGIECGNVLGLGGAMFAAIIAISALAKEEKDKTAEFLLSHPLRRRSIITSKLLSVISQIVILNIVVNILANLSALAIDETDGLSTRLLLSLAFLFMQIETACICFGISAFIVRGGYGIGIGTAMIFYFMNIVSNLTDDAKALKYITPFGYTDSSYIINEQALKLEYIATGAILALIGVSLAYIKYTKKDIK